MGIALSRAAGTQLALVERATTKRLQSAFAARDGVDAALLALGVDMDDDKALQAERDWQKDRK